MSTASLNRIKQEPPESDLVFNNVVSQEQQPKQQQHQRIQSHPQRMPLQIQQQQQQQQWEQQLMKFTTDLTSLSACICAFKNSFVDLHTNLDQIQNSIFSLVSNLQQQPQQQLLLHHHQIPQAYTQTQSTNISTPNVSTTAEPGTGPPPQTNPQTQSPNICTDNVSATTGVPKKPPAQMESGPGTDATDPAEPGPEPEYCPAVIPSRSSIENLCQRMLGDEVRMYITRNMSEGDPNVVREDVIASLKLAPNPAQLVLQCVSNWYVKRAKKRFKDKHKVTRVLIMEYFLLMMGGCSADGLDIESEPSVEEEAKQGAVAWRSRMITDGGIGKASEIDARSLLFFLACFGIPPVFTDRELVTLVRLSNIKEILNALKGSRTLPPRLPGIIEVMAKDGRYAEAIELACSFGIEEKISPQTILTTFLQKTDKRMLWKMEKLSPATLKKSKRRHLAALKSVVKFVEHRGEDLEKLCDGWQLKENIVNLEREISEINNNLGDPKSIGRGKKKRKRKLGEVSCSSNAVMSEEVKRSCIAVKHPPLPTTPSVNEGLNEQQTGVITPVDGAHRSLPYKDAFRGHHLSNNASASVAHTCAAPGVVGYSAAVCGHEARDAAGSFYARPNLRPAQPQPHGEISVLGNVPRMMGVQGYNLHPQYGWNGPGSVGQRAWLNPAPMMPASGGYHYYAPQSSNNHHQTMAP